MSDEKRIGLFVGREQEWPNALMNTINDSSEPITAQLVEIGGTHANETCEFDLIIDRMSHEIPYYRAYLYYAVIQGCTVINNPFMWAADSRWLGQVILNKLNIRSPRTVALPNKDVEQDVVPASFRNLVYPMDWQGIIDYVGTPAILKDVRVGGRRLVHRVHSLDELILHYDNSGTRTLVLQQVIESDTHVHAFVVDQSEVMLLSFSLANGRYLPTNYAQNSLLGQEIKDAALKVTKAYGYDLNMVEFVVKDGQVLMINASNPAPVMDTELMSKKQFEWCVTAVAKMAMDKVKNPQLPRTPFTLAQETT